MTLYDFGLCGVDNGRVSDLTDTLTITSADTKVVLYPVSGGTYEYPRKFVTGVTTDGGCFLGNTVCGFYQGLFKIDFEKPAPESGETITTDPCGNEIPKKNIQPGDPEENIYQILPTKFVDGWTMESWLLNNDYNSSTGNTLNNLYPDNSGFFFYIGTRAENKFWNVFSGETGLTTTTGIPLSPDVDVVESSEGWLNGRSNISIMNVNSSVMNTCCNPVQQPSKPTTGNTNKFCSEIAENALGFRITKDNRLGWRKVTVTGGCLNYGYTVTGETIEEQYTEDSVIPTGDTATLVQAVYTNGGSKHGLPAGTLKMYVNGRLVMISKEFIGLQLRALNEWSDKQQGVPFNMSWGGGTQGLLESETFGGPDNDDKGLMLETNFAGSFDGELSQLRFYKKPLNILELRHNLFVECDRYCVTESFGGLNGCYGEKVIPKVVSKYINYGKSEDEMFTPPLLDYFYELNVETPIGETLYLTNTYGYVYVLVPKNFTQFNRIKAGENGCSDSFTIPFNIIGEVTIDNGNGRLEVYVVHRTFNKTNYSGKFWLCD